MRYGPAATGRFFSKSVLPIEVIEEWGLPAEVHAQVRAVTHACGSAADTLRYIEVSRFRYTVEDVSPRREWADVNLRDKVRDVHRRGDVRYVRAGRDGPCCGVQRAHEMRGSEGVTAMRNAP